MCPVTKLFWLSFSLVGTQTGCSCALQWISIKRILWSLYKQAALSRSAPELPPRIKQMFPDHADIVGLEKNMVDSVLRLRNHALDSGTGVSISGKVRPRSKRQRKSNKSFVEQLLWKNNVEIETGVCFHLATEFFQNTIGTRQPLFHSPRYTQETDISCLYLNGAGFFKISEAMIANRQSVLILISRWSSNE